MQLYDRLRQNRSASDVAILHEDYYYRRRDDLNLEQRNQINYDHPDAFEHDLLIEHLQALRCDKTVLAPQYDYRIHNRSDQTVPLSPARILILEGILILHDPGLRELLDLKVFVDVPLDVCLARRIRRDTGERGRSVDSVLDQYHATVRPMFFRFVEPTKEFANLIVPHGGDNQQACDVLHGHLSSLLAQPWTPPL